MVQPCLTERKKVKQKCIVFLFCGDSLGSCGTAMDLGTVGPVTSNEVQMTYDGRIAEWSEILIRVCEERRALLPRERTFDYWVREVAMRRLPANLPQPYTALVCVPIAPFPQHVSVDASNALDELKWIHLATVLTAHRDNVKTKKNELEEEERSVLCSAEAVMGPEMSQKLKTACQEHSVKRMYDTTLPARIECLD